MTPAHSSKPARLLLLPLLAATSLAAWSIAQPPPAKPDSPAAKHEPEADEDDEVVIKLSEAPAPVQAALAKLTPADKVTKVIKEEDEGITTYEVEYTENGMSCSAVFSAAGDLMELEKGIKESALPPAALAALKKNYPAATFGAPVAVQKFSYEVQVTTNGKKHEIKIDAAGNIDDKSKHDEGDDDKDERGEKDAAAPHGEFRSTFAVNTADLAPTGASAYFILQPGHTLTYTDGDELLVVTVLNDTRVVDGVTTRVVEERESKAGALVEVSRNFFAIEPKSGDVYYFGEDVDIYKDGKVVKHEGEWLSGEKGAHFGLFVPGKPKVGDKYHQEVAPHQAMDRFEVLSNTDKVETPAGKFENVLKTEETTPLESGKSNKWFAPGVGMIRDGDLKLTKIEPAPAKK